MEVSDTDSITKQSTCSIVPLFKHFRVSRKFPSAGVCERSAPLREPLPCKTAAELLSSPWCGVFQADKSQGFSSPEECFFKDTGRNPKQERYSKHHVLDDTRRQCIYVCVWVYIWYTYTSVCIISFLSLSLSLFLPLYIYIHIYTQCKQRVRKGGPRGVGRGGVAATAMKG